MMTKDLVELFIDRLNLDILSKDTQTHFYDVMTRYMSHGRTYDFIVRSLDKLLEFFDIIGINRIEAVIVISNDPSLFNDVDSLYDKYLFLGIIENEENTFRNHKFFSKTRDYRVSLDTMYKRYRFCLESGYTDIKWNTLVHATDNEFAKIFVESTYRKPYQRFDTLQSALEYIGSLEYPAIDIEEFKNLEVNREIVEKYEGKRRTM